MFQIPEWLPHIRGFIIDMDGVLYRGDRMIAEVPRFMESLQLNGIPYMMATNNATATPQDYEAKLASMGLCVKSDRILTSALATVSYLRSRYPKGTRIYVVGMSALREAIYDDGYFVEADRDVNIVVSGAHFNLRYDHLKTACLCIRAGADYVATNADRTFPSDEGVIPGSGAIVAALVASTDVEPTVIGKPSPVMVETCLTTLGIDANEAVILGDRLDTDILAGQRAGTRTVMVLTGISSTEHITKTGIEPDTVISNLDTLSDWLDILCGRHNE